MEDKEIIIDGVDVAGCCFSKPKKSKNNNTVIWCDLTRDNAPIFRCGEMPYCYYKRFKRLEQENARKKDMIERQWKLLKQCGVSSGGELKRVSYLLEKLRDENKINMSSVFNLSIELQKALDENTELIEDNLNLSKENEKLKKTIEKIKVLNLFSLNNSREKIAEINAIINDQKESEEE